MSGSRPQLAAPRRHAHRPTAQRLPLEPRSTGTEGCNSSANRPKGSKKKRPTKHDKTIFKIWTTYLNLWKLVLAGPANQKACHQVNSSHLAKQLWPRWYPPPSAGLQWRTATGARRQHTGSAEADAGSAGSCGGDGSQQLPSRLPLWNVKSCRAHGPSILRYECIYWCHVIPQTAETPLACYLAGAHR